MEKKFIPAIIIALLLVSGGSFYAGTKYATGKNPTGNGSGLRGQFGQGSQNGGPRNTNRIFGQGGAVANGEVIAVNDKSLTVKLRDGGSKIIFLSGSSQIFESTQASSSNIAVGKSVMVNGTANADGSLTAVSIQLRPNMPNPPVPPTDTRSKK